MKTVETLSPEFFKESSATDPKAALQADADMLFTERAKHILPTTLGRLVLGPRDLRNRKVGDSTLLSQYIIPSQPVHTEQALERFAGMISNLEETKEKFDEAIDQDGLSDPKYSRLLILAPHTSMTDILGILYTSFFASYGRDRNASDNYIYLSRMLAYAQENRLFGPSPPLVENRILPVANVIQVFPETASLKGLWKIHEKEMNRANKRSNLAQGRHQKEAPPSEAQKTLFMAPTGAKMPRYKKGKKTQLISEATLAVIHNLHRNGVPLSFQGWDVNIPLAVSRLRGKQPIAFASERAIMPEDSLSAKELEIELKRRQLSVARQVSKKYIYA